MVCSRFGEICFCWCLTSLLGPAWVLLNCILQIILCCLVIIHPLPNADILSVSSPGATNSGGFPDFSISADCWDSRGEGTKRCSSFSSLQPQNMIAFRRRRRNLTVTAYSDTALNSGSPVKHFRLKLMCSLIPKLKIYRYCTQIIRNFFNQAP